MASAKYREIAAALTAEIADLPPGTKVDGELAIAARFDVSRAAARAAVQELERQFLVRRVRGMGTFTARRVDYPISSHRAPSWSHTLRDAGATPRTVVRSCESIPMPAAVAAKLDAPEGTAVWRLQRRSFTDELPASWGTEWVPAATVPELPTALRVSDSLDHVIRTVGGVAPTRSWVRASMEAAPDEVADELAIDPGAAVWFVKSLNTDRVSGTPVCLTERWIRADAIRVVFEVGEDLGG
ncbi:hypothetical protein BJF85_08860 [Saccharomonospora sp. CUA-673]|uniref:GntR family transcriptional regulator n=1 Tax=Saccharomonospora sp. CUA-673 TaxID=1904969 RepID=UPI000968F168|nr:GntR family transcriptional regulator [Saccharomonospora sp. CUA-673]OLT38764.1 hypothetical protein BJF85_08860 [Saccharomonospora sp. CUA-673]